MAHELVRRLLAGTLLLALAQASLALTPYFSGDKQAAGDVKARWRWSSASCRPRASSSSGAISRGDCRNTAA